MNSLEPRGNRSLASTSRKVGFGYVAGVVTMLVVPGLIGAAIHVAIVLIVLAVIGVVIFSSGRALSK